MELSRGLEVLSPREEARLDWWHPLSRSPSSPLLYVTLGSRGGLREQHCLGQDKPHLPLEMTACVTFYRSHCLSPQTYPKGFYISPKPAFKSEKDVKSTHT